MYTPESILEYIEQFIEKRYLEITDLSVVKSANKSEKNLYSIIITSNPTVWRPDASKKLFAKIKLGKQVQYVGFSENCKKIFDECNIPFSTIKSSNTLRIDVDEFFKTDSAVLKKLFNEVFINSFNIPAFGCCGKYKECEETGNCTHADIIYSNACQYRRITTRGTNNESI